MMRFRYGLDRIRKIQLLELGKGGKHCSFAFLRTDLRAP